MTVVGRKIIEDSIIIRAEYIKETDKAWYLNCEGDKAWFPKTLVNFNIRTKELEVPQWKLRELGWD